jgi:xanthine/CO dehydrogenase XdhC/CoxF family maturation factor
MKDIPAILAAWRRARSAGEEVVLATVVRIQGSAYRRPGTRMLITADRSGVGMISGGCLEAHVTERAWWLTGAGRCALCRYDTGAGEDTEWAFGLGCNGVVDVLLERLGPSVAAPQLEMLDAVQQSFRPGGSAVVIGARDAPGVSVGQRVVIYPEGRQWTDVGDGHLAALLAGDLGEVLRRERSSLVSHEVGAGGVEVFLEHVPPPMRLVVFGAGPDAQPLVRVGKELGWHVRVVDGRSHYARRERFPQADAVVVAEPRDAAAGLDPRSAAVVMTHSYEQDKSLLRELLRAPPAYLGQLGPRSRTERILRELAEEGGEPLDAAALHYPVGLDIGADNPEEIAVAILAEIKTALAGRTGGMLRRRAGSIHD